MICGYVSSSNVIYAHQEDAPRRNPTTQKPADTPGLYTYTTPAGSNLSLLARRSLQLLNQGTQNVSISPAQAMFVETNVVKQLGDRWLEVGEKVTIEKSLLEEYARKSQTLTTEQLAAWQAYADQTDFNLSSINPDVAPVAPNSQSSDQIVTNESQQKPVAPKSTPKSSSPAWYLWVIVGAALGSMYRMMNRPPRKK